MLADNKTFDLTIEDVANPSFVCVVPNLIVSMNDKVASGWCDFFSEVKPLVTVFDARVGNCALVIRCEVILDEDRTEDVEGDMKEVFKFWLEADACVIAELVDILRTDAGKGSKMI